MLCRHCGSPIPEDNLYCGKCGTQIDQAVPKETTDQTAATKEVKKTPPGCLIAIFIVIGLFVLGGIICSFSTKDLENKSVSEPSEPVMTEEKRSEKLNELHEKEKVLNTYITMQEDEMEKTTWLFATGTADLELRPFGFYPYIGESKEGYHWLRLKTGFHNEDWIFFNRIIILVDDKTSEIEFNEYKDKETEVNNGIYEWIDINADNKIKLLESICNGKRAKIRFDGKYHLDFELTQKDIINVKHVLEYYKTLKEIEKLS
jgi:hypothetical protein